MNPSLLSVYPGLYFPRYAAYGFGVPTTIVLFALSIDTSGFIPSLTVGYGKVKTSDVDAINCPELCI